MCECLAGAGCCLCVCCCGDCSEACKKTLGREKVTKFCYLFIVIVFTIPAIVILFFINKWSSYREYFSWMSCPQSSGTEYFCHYQWECIGASTVFRISLSFLCLFGILFLIMLCRCRLLMAINEGFFCVKYIIVLAIFIAFLFAPNESFVRYADASKIISIGFMILQAIILVDLFYLAGIQMVAKYDEGQTQYGCYLVALSILVEAIAVVLNILGYVYFAGDICGSTLWVNIITTIILIVLPILQLCHFNKQNSLLTTALVSAYISYLAFVAQFSYGDSTCTQRTTVGSIAFDIIVSTFLFLLTMYGSIMGGSGQVKYSQNGNLNQAIGVAPTHNTDQDNGQQRQKPQIKKQDSAQRLQDPESDEVAASKYTDSCEWVKWHFYMCIASIYIAMLVTNWTSASPTTGELVSHDFGFWVRVPMSWLVTLLYIWTLVAPRCFPDRDFTVT